MIQEMTRARAAQIKDPVFREYAHMYLDIYDDFTAQAERMGLPFCKEQEAGSKELREELRKMGISSRCDGASLVYGWLSPACQACKRGIGMVTSYISFQCHRHCFFCFNPNQDNFLSHLDQKNDWRGELEQIKGQGGRLSYIALTGGEPLLYPEETAAFFKKAGALFPGAHRRLYTSGDLLTEGILERLKETGLEEIRFSYKIEDDHILKEKILHLMELAKRCIPSVMVEMPVMPDAQEEMESLLRRLDDMGISGINLLELGFPFYNAEAFLAKGYRLRYPPFKTLYDLSYAGGLPVAGSELVALKLLYYAAKEKLGIGVHYCSLENKNFGQRYQQNQVLGRGGDDTMFFPKETTILRRSKPLERMGRRHIGSFSRPVFVAIGMTGGPGLSNSIPTTRSC